MKVLVVGGGGREHTLAWALARSTDVTQVLVAPGNAGTQWTADDGIAPCENVAIGAEDLDAQVKFAVEQAIDLVVVGPEVPLAMGLVDALQSVDVPAFGPSKSAAQVEASKAFSKQLMQALGIPTARYGAFTAYEDGKAYLDTLDYNVVVKADGLAAGKGVIVCENKTDAQNALKDIMLDKAFGQAGSKVIIEERLEGPEVSVMAFCDGENIAVMPPARDHKRALDNDKGLNTGGMGAFSPVPDVSAEQIDEIAHTVIQPIVDGMKARGIPYKGVLYAGLMLTESGPRTLEYNCRFGDPETQVILPRLQTDLARILLACIDGTLDQLGLKWADDACATVVLTSPGYPESYPKGLLISGLDHVNEALVFHAGTAHKDGQTVTSGGRVISVSALGASMDNALESAYRELQHIHFDGVHYRTDIGRT